MLSPAFYLTLVLSILSPAETLITYPKCEYRADMFNDIRLNEPQVLILPSICLIPKYQPFSPTAV